MTTPIRLLFFCMKGNLEYIHELPSSLLASWYLPDDGKLQNTNIGLVSDVDESKSDEEELSKALAPLMAEHEEACRAALPPSCRICGREVKMHPLFTPVSFDDAETEGEKDSELTQEISGKPEYASKYIPATINIWVDRHCSRSKCREQAKDEATKMLALYNEQIAMLDEEEARWGKGLTERETVEWRECDGCGKIGDMYYCHPTCEAAVYCGKECQMSGWPRHKGMCMIGRW